MKTNKNFIKAFERVNQEYQDAGWKKLKYGYHWGRLGTKNGKSIVYVEIDDDELKRLIDDGSTKLRFNSDALNQCVVEMVANLLKNIDRDWTLRAAVGDEVEEHLKTSLKTQVGNWIRVNDHTVHKLIDQTIKAEIESGIRGGIKYYAKQVSEKIANALANGSDSQESP